MNKSLALLIPALIALTACQKSSRKDLLSQRPVNKKPALPPQKLDECPAAEGQWTIGDNPVTIGRQEGFLTLRHKDLSDVVVMDSVPRKIKQPATGATPEVTGSCAKQIIQVIYKFEGNTVAQLWNIDLEKDIIVITEKDGETKKTLQGQRVYANPTSNAPAGE